MTAADLATLFTPWVIAANGVILLGVFCVETERTVRGNWAVGIGSAMLGSWPSATLNIGLGLLRLGYRREWWTKREWPVPVMPGWLLGLRYVGAGLAFGFSAIMLAFQQWALAAWAMVGLAFFVRWARHKGMLTEKKTRLGQVGSMPMMMPNQIANVSVVGVLSQIWYFFSGLKKLKNPG